MADSEKSDSSVGEYTKDGTVNIKGRPFRRSKGGRWLACSFIVVDEAFERLAFFGIAPNLVIYLTNNLHQSTVSSANNVTNWYGTVMIMPVLGAYIADAHLGRYWTIISSSAIYLLGMILLTLTVSLPFLRPPPCDSLNTEDCNVNKFHTIIFFVSLYIIALGAGGTKPNISTLGADQFDVFEKTEREQKLSYFNWWTFAIFTGNLFSHTILIYIQDTVSWSVGYIIATVALAFSIIVFLAGTPFYRHRLPSGSPVLRIVRVLVAAIRKWKIPLPEDSSELYELDPEHYLKQGKHIINHTDSLRFLDKSAVYGAINGPWMLVPVTQVEETKQIIKLLPVLFVTIIPSMTVAQVMTLFIKQGTMLDRSMGPHFSIPPGSLSTFFIISTLASIAVYDQYFVPFMRMYSKNPRGITLLQRIGIGQALHIVIMIIAALTEWRRLHVVRDHGLIDQKAAVPLTIFVLLPQFALMGIAEMFVGVGKIEFFYDQVPEEMKSVGPALFSLSLGLGNFVSSFVLSILAKVTRKRGKNGWIENNLNASHLDYYYEFLAVLNALNFVLFLVVSKFYVYKREVVEPENDAMGENVMVGN